MRHGDARIWVSVAGAASVVGMSAFTSRRWWWLP